LLSVSIARRIEEERLRLKEEARHAAEEETHKKREEAVVKPSPFSRQPANRGTGTTEANARYIPSLFGLAYKTRAAADER